MPRQVRRQPKPAPTAQEPKPAPTAQEPKPAPTPRQPKPAPTPRQPKPAPTPRQPKPAPTPRQPKPAPTPRQHEPAATPQQPKPAATCQPRPQVKSSSGPPVNGTTSINYNALKRSELQQCCKELGLRATGKNAELVERLQACHLKPQLKLPSVVEEAAEKAEEHHQTAEMPLTVLHPNLLEKVKSEPVEEKREVVQGWCVVHGMTLYRPSSSWAPLLLRRGLVYVRDGENLIPFHLHPLNSPVPDGLLDNYICGDCALRNRKNLRKFGRPHDFLSSKITLKYSTSHPSPPPSCAFKDRGRTSQSRKSYRPQEDRAYAQKVDGILFQMAHGKLGMDQVLHPLQPLVVHSPAPFNQ